MRERIAQTKASPADFRELCSSHGLAVTHQRQIIYQELMAMHGHPSPESVYEKVRVAIPAISLATVYKTIHTFLEAGLIQEVSIHHGTWRIEANREPHYHLICSDCRSMTDLDESQVSPIKVRGTLPNGFEVRKFALDVIGLCAACRAKAKKH